MQRFQPVNVSCRRVLIVEDEFAIADELASELTLLDATIVGCVASAQKALEIITSGVSPDLALVDLRLSDGSGEGLISELHLRGGGGGGAAARGRGGRRAGRGGGRGRAGPD